MAISPNGLYFVSGEYEGQVKTWSNPIFTLLLTFENKKNDQIREDSKK